MKGLEPLSWRLRADRSAKLSYMPLFFSILVGVVRFELTISAISERRPDRANPHPQIWFIFTSCFFLLSSGRSVATLSLFFLSPLLNFLYGVGRIWTYAPRFSVEYPIPVRWRLHDISSPGMIRTCISQINNLEFYRWNHGGLICKHTYPPARKESWRNLYIVVNWWNKYFTRIKS